MNTQCRQSRGIRTHGCAGKLRTPEYTAWFNMLVRCGKPNHKHFHRYGGRGIQVCDRWQSFENFLEDMKVRPSNQYSLDRINNDGNYEPENCRWALREEQHNNTSSNKLITLGKLTMTISQWARWKSIHVQTLIRRLRVGWLPMEDILYQVDTIHRNGLAK